MSKTKRKNKRYNKHSRLLSAEEKQQFENAMMIVIKDFMREREIKKILVIFTGTGFDIDYITNRKEKYCGAVQEISEGLAYYMLENNLLRLALKLDKDTDTLQKIELKAKQP